MDITRAFWRLESSSGPWAGAYRLVNLLLRAGLEAYWVTDDEPVVRRGDFVVASPPGSRQQVMKASERLGVRVVSLPRAPTRVLARLWRARVAIYGGGGAPFNHARILADLGFDVSFLSAQAVQVGALEHYDVFVVPGGGRTANRGQLRLLGEPGARAIARFVEQGGLYVGSCAGAHNVIVIPDAASPKYGQRLMQLINIGMWHGGEGEWHWQEFPGVGVILCRNLSPDHPVMWGIPEVFSITHYNGPFFSPMQGALKDASTAAPLAGVVGYTKDFTPGEYALSLSRYEGRAPGSVIERAIAAGALTAAVGDFGRGRVVVFGSHPEFGYTLEMDTPEVPACMLANAVLWQSIQRTPASDQAIPNFDIPPVTQCERPGSCLHLLDARVEAIREAADVLRAIPLDPLPSWLAEDQAMSTFGLSGRTIWHRTLNGLRVAESRLQAAISRLRDLVRRGHQILELSDPPTFQSLQAVQAELLALERALHYAAPAAWDQDFGYQGLIQTLAIVENLLRQAAANVDVDLSFDPDPYAHDSVSPYHLVAACYYSALGVFLNASYLAQMHESRLEQSLVSLDLSEVHLGGFVHGR